jgi:trimeric autotransporter adhesin
MKKLTLLICLFISIESMAQPFSKLKDINSTATANGITTLLFQRSGNTVYFLANDGISGNELWKSDGTEAGTVLVKDITPGSASTNFNNIMLGGNGLLFFVAEDPVNGREPWISDGTAGGTFLLKDINPGTATSGISRGLYHNGFFYFGADDGLNGQELWKTDGTTAGTVLVKDILPGASASSPGSLSNPLYTFVGMGNEVYFGALGPVGGRELWKTDGTSAGTVMVKDIFPGANGSVGATTHKAFVFNGKLYFAGNDGLFGSELWVTDGTEAGTYRVKDIVSGSGNSIPNDFTIFNGELFFTASSVNNGNPDLYKTDGTEAGTVLVRSLSADGIVLTSANSSAINSFVQAGNKMFFRATGPLGVELYATDGTGAGTGLVKDIFPGSTGANPQALFEFLNKVYFTALDPSNNRAIIYSSDGTESGTLPAFTGSLATNLSATSGFLLRTDTKFFFYGSDMDGLEMWVSDGTTAGTSKTKDINQLINGTPNTGSTSFGTVIFNGAYYFGAGDEDHGMELWKSDGTTAGTVMVKDIWPGIGASVPSNLTVFNGVLYFVANDGNSGNELWKTDGTEAGTVMVAEIAPGSVGSSIFRLIPGSGYLYFSAFHPTYGFELWRTDGTAAGTVLVADLVTGPSNYHQYRMVLQSETIPI